jgi:hypothetical protein
MRVIIAIKMFLYQFYMRLRSIRVAAIHELPLQCVVLHQSYKAHLQTEMVLVYSNKVLRAELPSKPKTTLDYFHSLS